MSNEMSSKESRQNWARLIQKIYEFEDSSGIKYTVARYYTPNKKSLQGRGVIPDIEAVQESDFFCRRK